MNLEFSQKEKDIFEGVLSLARKGESIYTLKVQQIADAAKIGKSTLYEYFDSREEILAKALLYSMNIEMTQFNQVITANTQFIGMVNSAIDFAHECVLKNSSTFSLLNSAMQEQSMRKMLCSYIPQKDVILQALVGILNQIIIKGRQEGVVDKASDDEYCTMTIISALCTVIFTTSHGDLLHWESTRANAIKMLCKALA